MAEGNAVRHIGEKVTAKYKSFFNEQMDKLHSAWIPMIEVDGSMLGIFDESSESGQLEQPTRYKALKLAKQVRDETKERLQKKIDLRPIDQKYDV